MRTSQQMSITLPNEMADVVKSKVRAGEYASESEVIRDGLRADPSRAVTPDQVRARLAAEHAKAG